MIKNKSRGSTAVVSLIIAIVIAAIFAIVFILNMTGSGKKDAKGKTPLGKTTSVRCAAQRKNIETALYGYYAENGRFPEKLEELEGFKKRHLVCPTTGNPFEYDRETGTVICLDHLEDEDEEVDSTSEYEE